MSNFHSHKVKLLVYFILLFMSFTLTGQNGQYLIRNFSPEDYRAGIQNNSFAQNRSLSIFVANNLGILEFDGTEWKVHRVNSGKKERSLLFDDTSNRLFFGSQGDFGYFENDWEYRSLTELLPKQLRDFDEVWDVFYLDGQVYFCTFQGIFQFDGDSLTPITLPSGLRKSFLVNNQLFVQSNESHIYRLKGNTLELHQKLEKPSEIINGIVERNRELILFSQSGNIYSESSSIDIDFLNKLQRNLVGQYINHVQELSDGRIAISTQTSGIYIADWKSRQIIKLSKSDGLQSDVCLKTFEDFNGKLWIGMQNGISIVDLHSSVRLVNEKNGLDGSGYDYLEDGKYTYYTTSTGLFIKENDDEKAKLIPSTEGPSYSIKKLRNDVYVCNQSGLLLADGEQVKQIASIEGLWDIKPLTQNPNYLIGGTYKGLHVFKWVDDKLVHLGKIEGFNESSRFFEEDDKGTLWVSQFYKGLYNLKVDLDNLKLLSKTEIDSTNNLPLSEVIVKKIQGEIYVASKKGLYVLDQHNSVLKDSHLFESQLENRQVHLIDEDAYNNIHVFTDDFIGYFKRISNNNYKFQNSSLSPLRYSMNNDLLNFSKTMTKGVSYAANEGFIRYYPEEENQIIQTYPLYVKWVKTSSENDFLYKKEVFGEESNTAIELDVPPNANLIQLAVAFPAFNLGNGNEFRFQLEGFDKEFGPWENTPYKTYTNLEPGSYKFRFESRDRMGRTISGKSISIEVLAPFYATTYAKYIYALLALVALYLLYHYISRWFSRKNVEFEKSKVQLARSKEEEISRLESKKEDEVRQLQLEKVQNELNFLNQALSGSTMNLVVKNELIEKIKSRLENLNESGINEKTKKSLNLIILDIERSLRVQDDWVQFESQFNKVHGDFLDRLRSRFKDLSPNDQKLCTFLRLNLSTKEIASLMNISKRGVEIGRFRLRKKLNLQKGQNLAKFILDY